MKKLIATILLASLFVIPVAGIGIAHAEGPSLTEQGKQAGGILYIASFTISKALQFLGNLTNWALNLNGLINTSPTIRAGWVVTRDLANLGFVLAIIVIAFATIIQYKGYQMKEMLVDLIIVAITINFSLVIAGLIIDFAGMLTSFFLASSLDNPSKIADTLVGVMRIQSLLKTSDASSGRNFISTILSFGPAMLEFIASLIFIIIFTTICAVTIGALGILLIMRYVALSILLILMPLAWFSNAIPALQSYNKLWWKKFISWTMFAPIMAFFIYLAVLVGSGVKGSTSQILGANTDVVSSFFGAGLDDLSAMIVVVGILSAGLVSATKAGLEGSAGVLKLAGHVKDWTIGRPSRALYTKGKEGKDGKGGELPGGLLGRAQAGLQTYIATRGADPSKKGAAGAPYVQRAANFLAGVGAPGIASKMSKLTQYPKESIEKYEKIVEKWSPDMVRNRLETPLLLSDAEVAALTNKAMTTKDSAADKMVFETLDNDLKKYLIENSKQLGNLGKILAARPDMAPDLIPDDPKNPTANVKVFNVMKKLKAKEAGKTLSPEAFKPEGYAVLLGLDVGHLTNIEKEAESFDLKDAILKKFESLRKDIEKGIVTLDEEETKRFTTIKKRLLYGPLWLNEDQPKGKNKSKEEDES